MASPVPLPPGALVYGAFEHLYLFEIEQNPPPSYSYDGAVVEYSTNDRATWPDASARFSAGQTYNGVISNFPGAYNPLKGKRAFVANSRGGKVYTRYNYSALAGQNVRLRFRIGFDYAVDWGWSIDNVDLYTCVLPPGAVAPLTPALNALVADYTPTLGWKHAARAGAYELQVFTDAAMKNRLVWEQGIVGSTYTFPTALGMQGQPRALHCGPGREIGHDLEGA